jgi:hypothetical protein
MHFPGIDRLGRQVAIVGGLTVLAAAVRLATLDGQSFWSDEALTVLLVRSTSPRC